MKRFLAYTYSICCICILFGAPTVNAEFLSINPLTMHATSQSGSAGVVILPVSEANTYDTGLLFYSTSVPVSAQGLTLANLSSNTTSAVLLHYNKSNRKFDSLIISGGKTFPIDGNSVTFTIGNLRVAMSGLRSDENPYVSVIFTPDDSVVAFLGLQSVFSGKGASVREWLDASTPVEAERLVIQHSNLLLNNMRFEGQKIGLTNSSDDQSACLSSDAIIISQSQLDSVLQGKNIELSERLKNNRKNDFITKYTILLPNVKRNVIALDGYGLVMKIVPQSQRLFETRLVCVNGPLEEIK